MSNQQKRMLQLLPVAALFLAIVTHMPPASAAGQDGMVAARDPQTGQLRAPTRAEMQELDSQARASFAAPAQPMLVARTDAVRQVRLGEKGLVYSVVTRDAEGNLVNQCVRGESAANAALARGAAVTSQEHHHEDR